MQEASQCRGRVDGITGSSGRFHRFQANSMMGPRGTTGWPISDLESGPGQANGRVDCMSESGEPRSAHRS
jgi:hypothetical protein